MKTITKLLFSIAATLILVTPAFAISDCALKEMTKYDVLSFESSDTFPIKCGTYKFENETYDIYAKTPADCARAGIFATSVSDCKDNQEEPSDTYDYGYDISSIDDDEPDVIPDAQKDVDDAAKAITEEVTTTGLSIDVQKPGPDPILIISLVANGVLFIVVIVLVILLAKKGKSTTTPTPSITPTATPTTPIDTQNNPFLSQPTQG